MRNPKNQRMWSLRSCWGTKNQVEVLTWVKQKRNLVARNLVNQKRKSENAELRYMKMNLTEVRNNNSYVLVLTLFHALV